MLSERQLEALLVLFEERMQDITAEYLTAMGKHLRDIGSLKASDIHRLTEMKRVGLNAKRIKREIAKAANMSVADLDRVFRAVAESDARFAEQWFATDYVPAVKGLPKLSKPIERLLKAQLRITAQAFKNLSQTTIETKRYRKAVDEAISAVQSGVTDYNSAIRRAMKTAAQDGLRVRYPNSGMTRRLDSAIRQNVLDGVRAINNDVLRQLGNEYGADGIEISAHALCATDHLPYQGLQFSNRDFEELQNSLGRPFGAWNCKHTMFPIILGVSAPAHDADELRMYRENSTAEIEIDGRTMSRYEWSQEQRRIETAVRAQKDIAIAAKASGDDVARREAQSKINALQEKYEKVSNAAGLDLQRDRMRVAGFRAVKTIDQLKNPAKSGIIRTEGSKEYMRIYDAQGKEKYRYLHTDAIQKLDSSQAVVQYFTYENKFGDTRSPITAEFGEFKLDIQKEIAEGIEWARTTYGLESLPTSITRASNRYGALGTYSAQDRRISFRPSTKLEDSFATAVHEMTHYADDILGSPAKEIVEQARKNLKLAANSRAYYNQRCMVTGSIDNPKDINDPHELLAYSLERYATGRTNKLAAEISRIWLERVKQR